MSLQSTRSRPLGQCFDVSGTPSAILAVSEIRTSFGMRDVDIFTESEEQQNSGDTSISPTPDSNDDDEEVRAGSPVRPRLDTMSSSLSTAGRANQSSQRLAANNRLVDISAVNSDTSSLTSTVGTGTRSGVSVTGAARLDLLGKRSTTGMRVTSDAAGAGLGLSRLFQQNPIVVPTAVKPIAVPDLVPEVKIDTLQHDASSVRSIIAATATTGRNTLSIEIPTKNKLIRGKNESTVLSDGSFGGVPALSPLAFGDISSPDKLGQDIFIATDTGNLHWLTLHPDFGSFNNTFSRNQHFFSASVTRSHMEWEISTEHSGQRPSKRSRTGPSSTQPPFSNLTSRTRDSPAAVSSSKLPSGDPKGQAGKTSSGVEKYRTPYVTVSAFTQIPACYISWTCFSMTNTYTNFLFYHCYI